MGRKVAEYPTTVKPLKTSILFFLQVVASSSCGCSSCSYYIYKLEILQPFRLLKKKAAGKKFKNLYLVSGQGLKNCVKMK